MIVLPQSGAHYLIRQPEHARQSAVITGALREEFVGDTAPDHALVVEATREHDMGWAAYEVSPRVCPGGLPVDFLNMTKDEHFQIWRRTTQHVRERLGAWAAAIVARHARYLQSHVDLAEYFLAQERQWRKEAAPEEAEWSSSARLERGYRALLLGDLLSLIACAGWTQGHDALLYDGAGRMLRCQAWRENERTVRVRPWPFAPARLEGVDVEAVRIAAGAESESARRLAGEADLVRVPFDFLPG